MIIGLTGSYCSGKDTVADYLVSKKGFSHISLSDIIRQELKKAGIKPTRENLIKNGTRIRQEKGDGYLAEKALTEIACSKDYIITSIRHPAEIAELKKKSDFRLIFVDAPSKLRFERMQKRKRVGDPQTFAQFVTFENLESKRTGSGQQLQKCAALADINIQNAGKLASLKAKIDNLLNKLKKEIQVYKRPNWDEYFMEIARVVGSRGTCDRGRAGAVIVKEKRIIATGYVGSPKGLPHCDEVGHLMSDVINTDGKISRHCIRTAHAEQNAIVQAALHGVSTNGATIYVKFEPCLTCAKMIINAGIKRVVCEKRYHAAALSREYLKLARVELVVVKDELEKYPGQK